jgi:hypothetical protein
MYTPPPRKNSRKVFKSSWQQARKVFVGGVPQSIDQDGLRKLFSSSGKIEKAWLQTFHDDEWQIATKNHRGFGFVLYYESSSVDHLLGSEFSRFVWFGDALKLEVKRAMGKTNIPPSVPMEDQRDQSNELVDNQWQTSSFNDKRRSGRSPHAPSHTWQNSDSFGFDQASSMHPWLYSSMEHGYDVQQNFAPWQSLPAPPPAGSSSDWAQHQNFLLQGFLGQMPQNQEELELVLREALPGRYDE